MLQGPAPDAAGLPPPDRAAARPAGPGKVFPDQCVARTGQRAPCRVQSDTRTDVGTPPTHTQPRTRTASWPRPTLSRPCERSRRPRTDVTRSAINSGSPHAGASTTCVRLSHCRTRAPAPTRLRFPLADRVCGGVRFSHSPESGALLGHRRATHVSAKGDPNGCQLLEAFCVWGLAAPQNRDFGLDPRRMMAINVMLNKADQTDFLKLSRHGLEVRP